MWAIYAPLIPLWFYYFIKTLNPTLYKYINPGIRNGGLFNVSKAAIYAKLPPGSYPATRRMKNGKLLQVDGSASSSSDLPYPIIVKPDDGCRGKGVKKIYDKASLDTYKELHPEPFLIQDFIDFNKEVAIFYSRHPMEQYGKISGITTKEFLTVVGNGTSSLKELLYAKPRYAMHIKRLAKKMDLNQVIAKGESIVLEEIGNHNKGTKFLDGSHLNSRDLEKIIHKIASSIPGFYYGRFDLKYVSPLRTAYFKIKPKSPFL
ncbi:hypothetical protein GCM10028791_26370 [Echinicola sediminis]